MRGRSYCDDVLFHLNVTCGVILNSSKCMYMYGYIPILVFTFVGIFVLVEFCSNLCKYGATSRWVFYLRYFAIVYYSLIYMHVLFV